MHNNNAAYFTSLLYTLFTQYTRRKHMVHAPFTFYTFLIYLQIAVIFVYQLTAASNFRIFFLVLQCI